MEKNSKSIDGLPAIIDAPRATCGFKNCWEIQKGKYEASNAARLAGMAKRQAQAEGLCQEQTLSWNSSMKLEEVLRTMHLPEWLDHKTAASFIVGVSFATLLHYARILLV